MWFEGRLFVFLLFSSLQVLVLGQGSSTLWTSFVPLTVRSPYLNAWMPTKDVPLNVSNIFNPSLLRAPSTWPLFYQNNAILGWAGLIRIDNATWKWLGDPAIPAPLNRSLLTNIQITPTRTIMNMTAGPIDLQVTWLSPLEPSDLVAQSLPFAYITLQARANDGQSHTVQVYSDISAEWQDGDRGQSTNWDVSTSDGVIFHEQRLVNPQSMSENSGQALDVTTYFGMLQGTGVTYMSDTDQACRNRFNVSGTLTNVENSGPSIIDKPFNVYAISKDLGSVGANFTDPTIWAIGMLRDPAITYLKPDGGVDSRRPYWTTAYSTPQDAVKAFLKDYDNASQRATKLDSTIMQKAATTSTQYADLVSLTARQAMAGTELTVSQDNSSDIKMFLKDLGGTSPARINPVEVLYSSFPYFLYMNASYGGYLLEPLLEFSNSSHWNLTYAPKDLGSNYPNATGDTGAHNEGVEQSGNMLIMTLAYARASGDGALLLRYYGLLKKWAEYLLANTLPVPSNQQDAEQLSSVNQLLKPNSTNLAIKGIIGIQAMSSISQILGEQSDAQRYSNMATAFVNAWKSLALSTSTPQHILSNYGASSSSWSLAYNLFADKWLGTGIIPQSVFTNEEAFLKVQVQNSTNGLPIQVDPSVSPPPPGNTAWTLFTAATVSDSNLKNALIAPIWNHASQNKSNTIFPTSFTLDAFGNAVGNKASPGVGGIFAPLALTLPVSRISVPSAPSPPSPPKKKSSTGAIVGGVIAALVGLGLLVFLGIFCWRRRHREEGDTIEKAVIEPGDTVPHAFPYESASQQPPPALAAIDTGTLREPIVLESPSPARSFPSSKARQAGLPATPRQTPTVSSSSYTATTQNSHNPPSTVPSSSRSRTSGAVSPTEVHGLRVEVENLRRVMQTFQTERFDPPPEYEGS